MSKKKAKGPMLFINQTFSKTPFHYNMQEIFISKPKIEELVEEEKAVQEKKIKTSKMGTFREQIPIEIEKTDNSQQALDPQPNEKTNSSLRRVKPFNEMDVRERIDYLLNIPKVLPPIPCVFYTTNQNYQGYLTGFEENQLIVQFYNKTTKTIPIDEIKNIIMIGLKK